jgi:hypothetical protein
MESYEYDWTLCIFLVLALLLIAACAYLCFVKKEKKSTSLPIIKQNTKKLNLNFILKKDVGVV